MRCQQRHRKNSQLEVIDRERPPPVEIRVSSSAVNRQNFVANLRAGLRTLAGAQFPP